MEPTVAAYEALRWQASLAERIRDLYPKSESNGHDFESIDGRRVIELKYALQGGRDLNAALMHLASMLADNGRLERATLVARFPKMSARRIREEWQRGSRLLRSDLATRLRLVGFAADDEVCSPDHDLELSKLAALARDALRDQRSMPAVNRPAGPWSPRLFDVWMVLLDAWLRCEPPLSIKEILARSGTSSATVKAALDRLRLRDELERRSNRSAGLARFPRRSVDEILTLTESLRHTTRFIDASGRPPDPYRLMRRLEEKAPPSVGLGGVQAARHYAPEFDLEGLPRLDITVHGHAPLEWLEVIDPGLRLARPDELSPILVVHRALRPDPGFERASSYGPSITSRAETLLDLYDLRLNAQAEDFVRVLRRSAKNP
jgi:hypothetical protein